MRTYLKLAMITALALGAAPSYADQQCPLTRLASLDMGTDPAGGVNIPAIVNGRAESLLVDTGGIASMLTESTVQNLYLKKEPISRRVIVFMPGARITELVHASTVQLENMKAADVVFFVMPEDRMSSEENGTLAPDFMANYDVEFDFAKGKFNLFSPQHCQGQVVYWTHEPYAQIPITVDRMGHIVTSIVLDGKPIDAMIDTGSSRSLAGYESTRDLYNWNDKTSNISVVSKRSDGTPATYHFPFKTLTLSGITVNNPDILLWSQVSPGDYRIGSPKMQFVLGINVLRQLHVYISYKEKMIYATSAEAH